MGTAAQFGGMGMSAGGAYKSALSQKIADKTNAMLATEQASQTIDAGQVKVEASKLHTAQLFGAQRAALAANGVDLGQGSATDVLTSTQVIGDKDAATIMDNALREAWGYQTQAAQYKQAAAQINPWTSAIGSLLGSANSTSGQSAFRNLGMSSGSSSGSVGMGASSGASSWAGGDAFASMG